MWGKDISTLDRLPAETLDIISIDKATGKHDKRSP